MPQVEVTFDIDANGILNVSAKDLGHGQGAEDHDHRVVRPEQGRDRPDGQGARAHSDEDRKRREEIEAKNRLDSLIYSTEKSFGENKAKLDAGEISNFESALADAKKALEAGGTENMNQAAERLQQASHKLAEAMYRNASQASGEAGPGTGGRVLEAGSASAKEDEVIDTEYVDAEKK